MSAARLEETDLLRLQLAHSKQEAAEHKVTALTAQIESATYALTEAMNTRNAVVAALSAKYGLTPADTIAEDGTIQRAGKLLSMEAPAS